MTQRRGQAALEFLSTYGFAFLLILVMIGALSYFGVLNPKGLVPDRCVAPAEFSCTDYRVQTNAGAGSMSIILINNLGGSFTPAGLVISIPALALTPGGCTILPSPVPAGQQVTITCATLGAGTSLPIGEKVKVQYSFSYTLPGKFAKSTQGEILTTVQP